MTDGTGTKQYTYVPVGSLGALQLQQESGPLPASTITSAYDELGRLSGRTVAGAGAETFQYDAIGRLTGRTNDLGAFTLSYLGQTDQVTTRQLASSTLTTTFSYLNNTGDRRLAGIANVKRLREKRGLTQEQLSDTSGFSQQYLSDLERGRRNPTIVSVYELAQALGAGHLDLLRAPRGKAPKGRKTASK